MGHDSKSTEELFKEIERLNQDNAILRAELSHYSEGLADVVKCSVEYDQCDESRRVIMWTCSGKCPENIFKREWIRFDDKTTEKEVGDSWLSNVHSSDLDQVCNAIKKAYQLRQTFSIEYRLIDNEGRCAHVIDSGVPRYDPDGNFEGYIGSRVDITDYKQVEKIIATQRDMSRGLSVVDTFEEALNEFMLNALKVSEMDTMGIYLFDDHSNLLLEAHHGLSPEFVSRASFYSHDAPQVKVVLNGHPVHTQYTEMASVLGRIVESEGIKAISVIPMTHMGHVIGCLNAGSRRFSEIPQSVKTILEAFSAQCAGMIIRLRTQQELKESHDRFRAMFEQIQDFIFIGNEQGDLIDFNPIAARKLGYSSQEMKSKKIIDLHPPEQRENAQDVVMAMLKGEKSNCIIPLQTKSGSLIPVETKVSMGNWGGKQYLFGMSRDLTDRIASQEALRKSEETYRQMFQVNHAVKLLIDPDTADIIDANQAAADFYGYPIEELKKMKLFNISVIGVDEIKKIMGDVRRSKIKFVPTQHIDRNKKIHDVEVFTSPLNLGEKTLLYAIVIDVSERKAAQKKLEQTEKSLREANEFLEQRVMQRSTELVAINSQLISEIDDHCRTASSLRESEISLKIIIDSAPIGIVVFQDGKYRYVNDTFLKILGLDTSEAAIGMTAGFFGGKKLEDETRRFLGLCIEKSEPINMRELTVKLKDSRELILNVWLQPLELWGQPSVIGFYIDVSGEMQLRAHLNQSQKMEALGSLAGGIAHDFNNILFAITGFAELALDAVKGNLKAKRYIDQLLKASDRAADLVRHILTFSREAEQDKRPLWVSPILKESLNFLRASIPAVVEIRRNIYPDGGLVNADPTQIHQVIMNLVTNAAHSMREKGGVLEVDLEDVELTEESLRSNPDMSPGLYQRLRVSDTGHGISPDLIGKIFDPYFTTKEIGQGTGLGLSVVDGIVRSHNGFIKVTSAVGSGTVFEVFLPVISEQAELEVEKVETGPLVKGKILLVDDEKIVTTATKANLENMGYEVEIYNDPLGALTRFTAAPHFFDLVITDMSMPRMNGAELSQAMLAIRNDMPIIMLSGFAELMNKEKAIALGLRDFLLKPLRRGVLADAVSQILKNEMSL